MSCKTTVTIYFAHDKMLIPHDIVFDKEYWSGGYENLRHAVVVFVWSYFCKAIMITDVHLHQIFANYSGAKMTWIINKMISGIEKPSADNIFPLVGEQTKNSPLYSGMIFLCIIPWKQQLDDAPHHDTKINQDHVEPTSPKIRQRKTVAVQMKYKLVTP